MSTTATGRPASSSTRTSTRRRRRLQGAASVRCSPPSSGSRTSPTSTSRTCGRDGCAPPLPRGASTTGSCPTPSSSGCATTRARS
eukprot:5309905-Alexandrium_andersonii.AAC.1